MAGFEALGTGGVAGINPVTGGASGEPDLGGAGGDPDGGPPLGGVGASGEGGVAGQAAGTGSGGMDAPPAFDPCPPSGDCKILPLGDSITFGSNTNAGGYRVELFTRAHADNKHITFLGSQQNGPTLVAGAPFPRSNEGHPGWTIAQVTNIADVSQALKDSPQIVLLHIGTNDMGSMSMGAPDRLEQLLDKIVTDLPNALVVVASIIPLPWTDATVIAYNATIPGLVQARVDEGKHVLYVEMHEGFPANGLEGDNIHPNDDVGYPWMGDAWYTAIAEYLH